MDRNGATILCLSPFGPVGHSAAHCLVAEGVSLILAGGPEAVMTALARDLDSGDGPRVEVVFGDLSHAADRGVIAFETDAASGLVVDLTEDPPFPLDDDGGAEAWGRLLSARVTLMREFAQDDDPDRGAPRQILILARGQESLDSLAGHLPEGTLWHGLLLPEGAPDPARDALVVLLCSTAGSAVSAGTVIPLRAESAP